MSTDEKNDPRLAVAVLTSCGAVGPLLSLVEPRIFADHRQLSSMLHDIVLLLLPLQVFGALEYSSGAAVAGTILVSANLALYWWLGRAILMQRRLLPTVLVTIPLACCWLALWVIKIAAAVMIHKSLVPEVVTALYLVGLSYLCKRIAGPTR